MSGLEGIGLIAAAGAAGMVNAVAGGGTLITFPVLLFFGTPAVQANATSSLALVVGTGGSLYGYRRQLRTVRPWLKWFVPVSLLGGLGGSILLTLTREKVFAQMVPFLIFLATLLFLGQGLFRRFARRHLGTGHPSGLTSRALWAAALFQLGVALYGGYFGAGIGILMLASLGLLGLTDIHRMNALKTVLGSLIKLVAALYFVSAGLIVWPKALVMIAGALGGYFAGAHYAQRIRQDRVRQIITLVGFVISGVTFYREFIR